MSRFLSLVCLAAAAISAVSAAAVSSAVPSVVESQVYIAPSAVVSAIPIYTAAVSNSTLEDRSTIEARASGGFINSCSSWGAGNFKGDSKPYAAVLQATCRTKSGGSKTTTLDLNRCFVNDNGNVRCQTNGGFLGSCQPLNTPGSSNGEGQWLRATCTNNRGTYNRNSIDLNACVGNSDGTLVC